MTGLPLIVFEFFKIGLFSIGGGLATLPFLYALADKYSWFTTQMVGDMIAISESTPGPMGVNMATYTGFQYGGIFGALMATFGLVLPSVIIIICISKALEKFRTNKYVEQVFYTIRPTVTGLIASAGFGVIASSLFRLEAYQTSNQIIDLFGIKEISLFLVLLIATNTMKKHPIFYIVLAAAAGVIFQF